MHNTCTRLNLHIRVTAWFDIQQTDDEAGALRLEMEAAKKEAETREQLMEEQVLLKRQQQENAETAQKTQDIPGQLAAIAETVKE